MDRYEHPPMTGAEGDVGADSDPLLHPSLPAASHSQARRQQALSAATVFAQVVLARTPG